MRARREPIVEEWIIAELPTRVTKVSTRRFEGVGGSASVGAKGGDGVHHGWVEGVRPEVVCVRFRSRWWPHSMFVVELLLTGQFRRIEQISCRVALPCDSEYR